MSRSKFKHNESYKHKLSKELLHKWLMLYEEGKSEYIKPFYFRAGNWGVHMELPFYEDTWEYYFEDQLEYFTEIQSLSYNEKFISGMNNGWELKDFKHKKSKLLFIPDICYFHKGTVFGMIEIVNTNDVSIEKMKKIEQWFNKCNIRINVFTIQADEILKQTKIPSELNVKLIT